MTKPRFMLSTSHGGHRPDPRCATALDLVTKMRDDQGTTFLFVEHDNGDVVMTRSTTSS